MIYRTYGRRGRGLSRGYTEPNRLGNGVEESSSQDAYEFSFPSQESWPDPYNFDSSQESRELAFLKPEVRKEYDGDVWKLNKGKVIDLDSETFCSSSGGEAHDFGGVEITGFKQPRKTKNVVFDSNANRSPYDLPDVEIIESRNCIESHVEPGLKGHVKKRSRERNGVLHKKRKKKMKSESKVSFVELSSTLMETQEGGETMEHLDEMNFALDGLKKGQPVRVQRASLLSLLSNCETMQQRRLLRIHGMAKNIIEAIMGLNLDDPPSSLAAAAIFYILTCDGQDDNLLGSPKSIRFLVKLLNPVSSDSVRDKTQPVGSKLLGLCKSAGFLQDSAKVKDSSSSAIMLKVQDILVSCKEMMPKGVEGINIKPELNHKWLALLIMEKACSSNISVEETSCSLRKTGSNFKEKLRQFGGLEAVFELTRKCHYTLEECLQKSSSSSLDSKDIHWAESLVLLLKCLKTMENATFLSKDNQNHLLGMTGSFIGQKAPRSFVKLILSLIKILSGASLLRKENIVDAKFIGSSQENMELASQNSCIVSQSNQYQLSADSQAVRLRIESSQTGSCSGASQNPEDVLGHGLAGKRTLKTNCRVPMDMSDPFAFDDDGKRTVVTNHRALMDMSDPFAFDDDECEPSKWDLMSGNAAHSFSKDRGGNMLINLSESQLSLSEDKPKMEFDTEEASCSLTGCNNNFDLADCLLTAVKVLMNLSNENSEGCEQIASCGGLEILCSLVACHFPIFGSSYSSDMEPKSRCNTDGHFNTELTDQQLDFLVAILGSLVNLVEKDIRNRSRLAKARISLPRPSESEHQIDVISLLCTIFLANQGSSSEADQEDKIFSLEDEDCLLQGEKEAEKMIVEAYSALLLAFLSTESKNVRKSIAEYLPDHNLRILIPILERFVEFHRTLDMISQETHSAVLEVIESCRIP